MDNKKMEELYLEISHMHSQINEIIDVRMKRASKENEGLDVIWALNVGFSAIFSSLLNFLDCLAKSCDDADDDHNYAVKMINSLKTSLLEAADVNKYFKRGFSSIPAINSEPVQ